MGQNEGAYSQPYQIEDPELFMQKGKNFQVKQGLSFKYHAMKNLNHTR